MILDLPYSILLIRKLSILNLFEFNDEIKPCNSAMEDARKRQSIVKVIESTDKVDPFEPSPPEKREADFFEEDGLLPCLPQLFSSLELSMLIEFVAGVRGSFGLLGLFGRVLGGRLLFVLLGRGHRLLRLFGRFFTHADQSQIQKNIKLLTLFLIKDIIQHLAYCCKCQASSLRTFTKTSMQNQVEDLLLVNGRISKQNINIVTSRMFEGQRLNYIVPGYTGHIPKKVYDDFQPIEKPQNFGKIPGYAGYVQAIKPQNLYGNTFGKTTLDVSSSNFIKGQDFQPKSKYTSSHTTHFIPPSQRLQRTAADIVGVPNTKILVKEPVIEQPGKEVDQFTLSKSNNFNQTVKGKDSKWAESKIVEKNGKEYVELGEPLPGYTGFGKRVMANNIFGKTYAECLKESKRDDAGLQHEKEKHYQQQLSSDVPFKF